MRIIDANALQDQYIAKMEEIVKSTTTPNISLEALSLLCGYALIMDAPTIEQCRFWDNESNFCGLYRPAATKHGKWSEKLYCSNLTGYDYAVICSECEKPTYRQFAEPTPNYCPNCGADMREESDIDENWYSDEYRRIGEDERDESTMGQLNSDEPINYHIENDGTYRGGENEKDPDSI